jgi:hypothetical protein
MLDPIVRPRNGVLLIALQSAEGITATPSPSTDAVPVEDGSVTFNNPYRTEDTSEINGSLVSSAPLVIGQPATVGFRSRIKGAGAGITYTSSVKPPLHAALQAAGLRGQFTAAVAAAALTAGAVASATLPAGFAATAQTYRGMPLLLASAPAAGRMPLVTDYTAGRVATLSDLYGSPLSSSNTAALPANWSYAGTSPADVAARATDHPAATIQWYEDGNCYTWTDCRGTVDFDGNSARPGFAAFSFTGIFAGVGVASVPNATLASHSAPLLVQGAGAPPAIQVGGKGIAISRWSLTNGFAAGVIGGRTPVFEADPLMTLVNVRNSLNEIAAFTVAPVALQFGSTAGNRVSILVPTGQAIDATPGTRGSLRSETRRWQALNPGDDAYGRDGDRYITFS